MRKPTALIACLGAIAFCLGIFKFLFDQPWLQAITLSIVLGLIMALVLLNTKMRAIFSIPELRQKVFITLLFLVIYRIGYFVPLPFINQDEMNKSLSQQSGTLNQVLGRTVQAGTGTASGTFQIKRITWDESGTHYDCTGAQAAWAAKLG